MQHATSRRPARRGHHTSPPGSIVPSRTTAQAWVLAIFFASGALLTVCAAAADIRAADMLRLLRLPGALSPRARYRER